MGRHSFLIALCMPAIMAWLVATTATAAAAPTVIEVETGGDGSGNTTSVLLTFSQPIDATAASTADFTITDCVCLGVQLVDENATDNVLRLVFAGERTDVRPSVAYAGGTITGRPGGLGVAQFPATKAADRTPPVLLSFVSTGLGWRNATVTFSEPVYWIHNGDDPLGRELFTYTDSAAGGTTGIAGSARQATAGNDIWWVDLIGETAASDEGRDTVSPVRAQSGQVEIVDAAGNRAEPRAVPVKLDHEPPARVLDLSSHRQSDGIRLTWTTPSDVDQTAFEIRWSSVRYAASGSDFANGTKTTVSIPAPLPSTRQTVVLTDLAAEAQVHIALRSKDRNENRSPMSNVVSNTTQLDVTAPTLVKDLTLVPHSVGRNKATVEWSAPADPGSGVVAYRFYQRTDALTEANKASSATRPAPIPASPGSKQSLQLPGLLTGTTYWWGIAGVDGAGNEASLSNIVQFVPPNDQTPPVGPITIHSTTHPQGQVSNATHAMFTWSPAEEPETPGSLSHSFSLSRNGSFGAPPFAGGGTSANLALQVNGEWCLRVTARSDGGILTSSPYCFLFAGGSLPTMNGLVRTEAGLTFPSAGDATLGVAGYEVRHRIDAAEPWENATLLARVEPIQTGSNITVPLDNDLVGTRQFAVRAVGIDGAGPWSTSIEVRFTDDATPPAGRLDAGADEPGDDGMLTIVWHAAKDNESAVHYVIMVNGVEKARTNLTSARITLPPGEHKVTVRAFSEGGPGPEETFTVTRRVAAASDPGAGSPEAGQEVVDEVAASRSAKTGGSPWILGGAALLTMGGGAGAVTWLVRRRRREEPAPLEAMDDKNGHDASHGEAGHPDQNGFWNDNGDHPIDPMSLDIECHACNHVSVTMQQPPLEMDCDACGATCLVEA